MPSLFDYHGALLFETSPVTLATPTFRIQNCHRIAVSRFAEHTGPRRIPIGLQLRGSVPDGESDGTVIIALVFLVCVLCKRRDGNRTDSGTRPTQSTLASH